MEAYSVESSNFVGIPNQDKFMWSRAGTISGPIPPQTEPVKMKYGEKEFLDEALKHIESTYSSYYVGGAKKNVQLFDLIDAAGDMEEFARWSAIAYLMRFGKKEGYNKKDLLKAIHYIALLWHSSLEFQGPTQVTTSWSNNQTESGWDYMRTNN